MRNIFKSLFLVLSCLSATSLWADATLFTTDFTTWPEATYSEPTFVNGVYFDVKNNKTILIDAGGVNFNGQNASTGPKGHMIGIPVTGVNGTIKIAITNDYSGKSYKYKVGCTAGTDYTTGASSISDAFSKTLEHEITGLSGSDHIVWVGEQGTSYKQIMSITITTPGESAPVLVTGVTLNKTELTLETGQSETLTATVQPENADNQNISWSSSNEAVVSVNSSGLVTALSEGEATVTVTTEDGDKTATCTVTVNEPADPVAATGVEVTPTTLSVEAGKTAMLTATVLPADATNKNIIWSTADAAIATVSNGTVKGIAEGETTITAKTADGGFEASCAVTVTPSTQPPLIPVTKTLTWQFSGSEAPALNTKEQENGITVEFLTSDDSKSYSVESAAYADAVPAELKSKGSKGLKMGANALYLKVSLDNEAFAAEDVITICGYNPWKASSSNAHSGDIAESVTTGEDKTQYNLGNFSLSAAADALYLMRALGSGTGITALQIVHHTYEAPVSVTGVSLNKTSAELNLGLTMQLTATVTPENATNPAVTWSSSDNTIASVNENGKVTALAEGIATITVKTEDGGFEATCEVTVVDIPVINVTGVSLDKTSVTIKVDETATLTATVLPEDATDKEVIWSTGNAAIATVTNGVVKGIAEGNTTITVKTQDGGFEATCSVKVEAKPIDLPTGITNRHEPEVYEAEKRAGGYNGTLTVFDNHEYEVYYITRDADGKMLSVSVKNNDKDNGITTNDSETKTAALDGWFTLEADKKSSSSGASAKDEFNTPVRRANMTNSSFFAYVKGYDQFSIYAKDNNANKDKGRYFKIIIDGVERDITPSDEVSIRRYDISTGEHLIEVRGVGGSNNELHAFSLRLAQEPRTKHLDGNDTTQNIFKTKDLYPIRYFTKYNHIEGAETKLEWEGAAATGIELQQGGRSEIGDTLIVSGTANCPAGQYIYHLVSSLNGFESSRVSGTFTVRTQLRASTETDVEAYKNEAIEAIEFHYYAFDEDIHFEWLNDKEPAGISTRLGDQTFTISGTPTVADTYQYRISVEGGEEITGTILVQDIDLGNNPVLYLYKNNQAYNDDGVYTYLKEQGYNLIARKTQKHSARPADQYAKYTWVLISEDVDADNPEVLAVAQGESNLPVLNMKAFSYAEGRLDWGDPNNGSLAQEGKSITVERADHPIFKTLNKNRGDQIQVLDSIISRGLMPTKVTYQNSLCLATALTRGTEYHTNGEAQTFLHEIPASQRNGHKYLSLPIAISSSKRLTTDGKSLIKATVEYLLNDEPTVALPTLEITSFIISSDGDDMKGLINQEQNTIYFEIDLTNYPSLDVKNVIPTVTIADTEFSHVTPAIGEAIDISTSIYLPIEYVVSDFINRRVYTLSARIFSSNGIEEVYVAGQWVNIFDIYGRKVATTNEDIHTIDLPRGIYLVVTENGQTIKIMR